MEPIFQCKYKITTENVLEFFSKTAPAWSAAIWYPILTLISGVVLYLAYRELHDILFLTLFAVFIYWFIYEQRKRSEKNFYKRLLLNKLDDLDRIIEFSEGIVFITPSTGSKGIYDYIKVKKFIESKNLYILVLPHQQAIYFEKKGFTIGDQSEFRAFIASKCVT